MQFLNDSLYNMPNNFLNDSLNDSLERKFITVFMF